MYTKNENPKLVMLCFSLIKNYDFKLSDLILFFDEKTFYEKIPFFLKNV